MTWGDGAGGTAEVTPGGGSLAATMPAPAPELAPATAPPDQLGVTLGAYRLVQRLGEGGMGVVHLGIDPHGRAVAIKVLRAHVAHDPDARERLRREVATLIRVQHRNVAEVLDADVEGSQPFVVTRYVPGPTLDAEVRERGQMPAAHLVRLGRGLSAALTAIHAAGVVHRDLKPGNVLLLDEDPVVIDFGIAHVADDVRLTMTGLVMGTPGYLAPELVEGQPVTEASDWWGWAATVAFAASGRAPFGKGPLEGVLDRVRRGVPDLDGVDGRLRPLLAAALAADPAARPEAGEVLAALDRYAAGDMATVAVPVARTAVTPAPAPPTAPAPAPAPPAAATRETRVPPTLVAPVSPPAPAPAPTPASPVPPPLPPPVVHYADAGPNPQGDQWLGPLAQVGPDGAPAAYEPAPVPRPARTATLLGLFAALVAAGSAYPTVTVVVALALGVLARAADLAVRARQGRQAARGPRGSDGFVSVVSAPWQLVRAMSWTAFGSVLPVLVGVSAAFCVGLVDGVPSLRSGGAGSVGEVAVSPGTQAAAAVGLAVGLLVAWWGPGSAGLRR